jgi:aminopeptidase N
MKRMISAGVVFFLLIIPLFSQRIDFYEKPYQVEPSRTYDALHYRIQIRIDIEGHAFEGDNTIHIMSITDGLDSCELDAVGFTVTSVADNWGKPLSFEHADGKLSIEFKRKYSYGENLSFTVSYQGQDPEDGLRFFDETDEHPKMAASDSWPYGVRHWFPCYDYPHDKVTHEIIATVASGNKVAANGRLIAVTENKNDGTVTYHWLQDLPHSTYLIFMAAAPYVVVEDHYKDLPLHYWVYPQHESYVDVTYGQTPEMVAFFNDIFDYPYPWCKYDQVSVPLGGGAESTTATAMTHTIMHGHRVEQDYTSIGIVSHELAHQWWGDLITLRSWAHAWMNEGFGTYCDYLYYRHAKGEKEGAVNLLGKKNSYLREARNRYLRPVVCHHYERPEDLFDAHSYPKAAVVLHMLRDILGDPAFFRTLSTFLHNYEFEAVDTYDFMKTVKDVTGRNLDWFFEQWIFSPGHPVLEIGYEWNADDKQIHMEVEQVQDTAGRIPVFRFPVTIKIVTAGGEKNEHVWIQNQHENIILASPGEPLLVRFDAESVLLKEWSFEKSLKELLYQVEKDDVIGRMWAVQELSEYEDREIAVSALKNAAGQDSFWAVRREAVQVLGNFQDDRMIDLLKNISREDERSQVRLAAIDALGDYKDKSLVSLFRQCFEKDTSYAVQAEALRAIGKSGDRSQLSFLEKALQLPSYRNWVKDAAQAAIDMLTEKK